MIKRKEDHSFSIELKSEDAVRKMSYLNDENGRIFFEGSLGELKNVNMVEGVMLEIEGSSGTLRLDINQRDMERCLIHKIAGQTGGETQ